MLDIGWMEFFVILVVALLVIGPKDLPKAMYTVGKWMRGARRVANDFQRHVNDMMREAELDEVRKGIDAARSINPARSLEKAIDPTGGLKSAFDINAKPPRKADDETSSQPVPREAEAEADRLAHDEHAPVADAEEPRQDETATAAAERQDRQGQA